MLLEADRLPSAVALSILSIEESGKVPVLRQMATADGEKEVRDIWKAYRSHIKKNVLWIFGELVAKGGRTLDELRGVVDPNSDHPDILDQLKQLSLYTDCFTKATWTSPQELDLTTLAAYLVKMAQILAKARTIVPEEVQLWRQHLWPVRNAPLAEQKRAVEAWYGEMRIRGLSDAGAEDVEQFLAANQPQA